MTDIEARTFLTVSPFLPKEPGLLAHVYRVAALAMRSVELSGGSREEIESAYLTGLLHHYEEKEVDAARAGKLWTALGMDVPRDLRPLPSQARKALHALRHPDGHAADWTLLVEAANLFDEHMENLPYEDVTTEKATQELCGSGMLPKAFVRALASFRVVSAEQLAARLRAMPAHSSSTDPETDALAWMGRDTHLRAHSVETGTQAMAMARESNRFDPAEAYLAGLVHDVGRLAYLPVPAATHLQAWRELGFPPAYAEFLISGTDHAETGAEFLRSRNFPEHIAEAVAFHHRPELTLSHMAALLYAAEDMDESLPSCARDHLSAKRLSSHEVIQTRAAGQL